MTSSADSIWFTSLAAAAGATAGMYVLVDNWRRRVRKKRSHLKVTNRSLDIEAPPKSGVDAGFLLGASRGRASSEPLESAIHEGDASMVADKLAGSDVFVLGRPHSDPEAEESELLHFEMDTGELQGLLLPVFTRPDVLQQALRDHPEWQEQSILEFKGSELLSARDNTVGLVIDPWSEVEFVLPPEVSEP